MTALASLLKEESWGMTYLPGRFMRFTTPLPRSGIMTMVTAFNDTEPKADEALPAVTSDEALPAATSVTAFGPSLALVMWSDDCKSTKDRPDKDDDKRP